MSGGECPAARDPSFPEGSGCVSVASKDGFQLAVYAIIDATDRPLRWHVRLRGEGQEIVQPLPAGLDYPRAIGGSDVDRDGRPEWWMHRGDYASHGAPWGYVNLFFLEKEELVPLVFEDGTHAINYGGITRLGEGVECRDGDLVILRAVADNVRNLRWRVIETTYSLDAHRASLVTRTENKIEVGTYVDPKIRRYFRINCYGDSFDPFF